MKKIITKILTLLLGGEPHYFLQNLSDGRRHIFWYGRGAASAKRSLRYEWNHGKLSDTTCFRIRFGGENPRAVCLSISVYRLFSYWLTYTHLLPQRYAVRGMDRTVGLAIFDNRLTGYFWAQQMEWSRDLPWWDTPCSIPIAPWEWRHTYTEILTWDLKQVLYRSTGGWDYAQQLEAEKAASMELDYTYIRKNGEAQHTIATVYVNRNHYRMRWLPFRKSITGIWMNFRDEIGEGVGSWKGGTIGCGTNFERGEKTAVEAYRRMMATRKFDR